jgi:hypothetical protein
MHVLRNLTMQRLMVMILFMLLFVMAVRAPTDTDIWWHVRTGDYIVEHTEIPTTGLFSYTRNNVEWIDHSWGSQVVIYGVYDLFGGGTQPGDGGNIGLALYMAILATGGMALVYRMCEGIVYVRAFAVVLGAAAAAIFWSPRPQMFSFVLGALVLYLLHLYKREDVDRLWLIPPIMAIWANLHGGFAIGFLFLFGSLAGEVIGNLFDGDEDRVVKWDRLRKMALVTGVSVPAIVLNPYGIEMLGYPFRTVGIGVLRDFIQEWASPDFHRPGDWPFAFLLLGVLAVSALSSRRIDWTDLALVGGTAFMGLLAARNIATFAIVATPVFSRHLNAWLADRGWRIRPRRTVSGTMALVNWMLLVVILLGALAKIAADLDPDNVREVQTELFPVELAQYLDESPPEGLMFNSYNWGGYFLFAAPEVPVYVDGRTDLYADAFLREFLEIYLIREGWDSKLDEKGIDFVAIEAESFLAAMLRDRPDQWREQQFDDGRSALFVRADSGE